jgi:hypothetical protein
MVGNEWVKAAVRVYGDSMPHGAVHGVDLGGGSPGTQNTDIIRPVIRVSVYGVLRKAAVLWAAGDRR